MNPKMVLLLPLLWMLAVCYYNPKVAQVLVHMSSLSYQINRTVPSEFKCKDCLKYKNRLDYIFSIKDDSAKLNGFVGYYPLLNSVIISFRGTINSQNWKRNARILLINSSHCHKCKVHRGFYAGYERIKQQIYDSLDQIKINQKSHMRILITGHSLGGALASLCALDLVSKYNNKIQLYTFGMPRIGNSKFAEQMNQKVLNNYRVVHYADIVTRLPPQTYFYRHSGLEIFYQKGMQKYQVCTKQSKDCSSSSKLIPFYSKKYHSRHQYIKLNPEGNIQE